MFLETRSSPTFFTQTRVDSKTNLSSAQTQIPFTFSTIISRVVNTTQAISNSTITVITDMKQMGETEVNNIKDHINDRDDLEDTSDLPTSLIITNLDLRIFSESDLKVKQ